MPYVNYVAPPTGQTPELDALSGPDDESNITLTLPWPVGIQADDIAIIHAMQINAVGSNSLNTPTGFTQINKVPLFSSGSTASSTGIYWKRLTGSESGSVTISTVNATGFNDTKAAGMTIWRGCLSSGDPFEGLVTARNHNASLLGSAVTTTGANRIVLHFGATYIPASGTAASGWTEQYDYLASSGTAGGNLLLYSKELAVAGTESAAVHPLNASERWVTFALAMIPA